MKLLLFAFGLVACHRPLIEGPSCSPFFGSPEKALNVPDITISWSFEHNIKCGGNRAVWAKFNNLRVNQKVYVGVGIPTLSRYTDIRADSLIIGPGLPKLTSAEKANIPTEVLSQMDSIAGDNGAIFTRSPADQSSCKHLSPVMSTSSSVRNGRCNFYEPYSGTNSWRVLDSDDNNLPQTGKHYVAVWLQENTSGKIGIAIGTWAENFRNFYQLEPNLCSVYDRDFSEKYGSQAARFPVDSCDKPTSSPTSSPTTAPITVPAASQKPATPTKLTTASQPDKKSKKSKSKKLKCGKLTDKSRRCKSLKRYCGDPTFESWMKATCDKFCCQLKKRQIQRNRKRLKNKP